MNITTHINRDNSLYPKSLQKFLTKDIPDKITAIGNIELLNNKKLAVFCSVKCPGSIIVQTHDCMKSLKNSEVTAIGGFHSQIEQECLSILLRCKSPIIICPARSIKNMRIKQEYQQPLDEGRLLFISPFIEKENRISTQRADARNHFAAALADIIFVPHAQPKGKTEKLCLEIAGWGKAIFTLSNTYNKHLISLGIKVVTSDLFISNVISTRLHQIPHGTG
ncbi:MAG: DNA-processing protein DprA [Proteobacteria bacterium]|nr:DNA-processing protein DprA [Pseudomonadota bacterium]